MMLRHSRAWRRGLAASELMLIIVAGLFVGGIGVVIVPQLVEARSDGGLSMREPEDPARREVFTALRTLFETSRAILGVWEEPGGASSVLLWHGDVVDPGTINESEVVLLSGGGVLSTVNAFVVDGPDADKALDLGALVWGDFADRWRVRHDIARRVVATDVAKMRVEQAGEGAGVSRITVRLTWADSAADEVREEALFEMRLPMIQGLADP